MLPLLLAAVLVIGIPARAQIYQITASGMYTDGFGAYSSLPAGTTFTFSETFNAATATLISSTSTDATYADPSGTSSFSFDGLNFAGTDPQIEITSGEIAGGFPLYGFKFTQWLTGETGFAPGYAVQLVTTNPSDVPSTSLSSLSSLQTAPISDFNDSLNTADYNGVTALFDGQTTSISVEIESAPEPSSIAFSALAVVVFYRLRRRCISSNVTA